MSLLLPIRRRKRSSALGRAIAAWALALAWHAALVGLVVLASFVHVRLPNDPLKAPKARPVTIRNLPQATWAANRGQESSTEGQQALARAPEPPKPEEKKPDTKPDGQIVDTAPGNGEEDPNAKYLAESSNKVKKETRAKEQSAFYRNAMPRTSSTTPPAGAQQDAEKKIAAGNNGIGSDDRPLREPKATLELPDQQRQQEIALKTNPKAPGEGPSLENHTEREEIRGNSDRLRLQPGTTEGEELASAGKAGAGGAMSLVPSTAVLDKLSGAAPNDHLDGVEEGDGTFLNTREWKYASFFNRVKQSVGMNWDAQGQLIRRDPTGSIYGGRDRYTVVNVTLNERGLVRDIYVEKSCGLDFLDLEAIQSFERAQPFPNPPPGLLTDDQSVRFTFGFFVEIGGGPRVRMFRQAN